MEDASFCKLSSWTVANAISGVFDSRLGCGTGGGCADSSGECVGGWSGDVVSEVVFSVVIAVVVVLIGEVSASLSSVGGSDVDVASDLTSVGGDGDDGGDGDSDNAANAADRSSQPSQLSVSNLCCCDSSPGDGPSPIVAFVTVALV